MQSTFTIAVAADQFGALNTRARLIVTRRLNALRTIHTHALRGSVNAGCLAVARANPGTRGLNAASLNRLYKTFKESGWDWRTLVDAAVAGPKWRSLQTATGLPPAFVEFLASEWSLNQRDKFRAVYTRLRLRLDKWRAGDSAAAIPGYDSAPPDDPQSTDGLPKGWTEGNLRKAAKARVPKFTRRLIQQGPRAAAQIGPMILSTREGKEPGQFIILDDSWEDFKVLAFGQTCRLLGFHALDLFSGMNIIRGYKPALKDENDVMQGLKEREMIFLLVGLFTTVGYRSAGTTLIAEKGTATVREREEQIFHDFGLPIKVQRGPAGGGPGISALFTGPGGGNPRWKAPLESWFNLQRNAAAGLLEFPGQQGSYSSGLPMPEGLPGLERDTKLVLALARQLPPERAELLRHGMLSHIEAITRLHDLVELINLRTDHALEGWRRCGNVITEWRASLSAAWQPEAKLLEFQNGEAAALAAVLAENPALKRQRNLSPAEVFARGQFKKMPMSVAAVMLAQIEAGKDAERSVKRGLLEVQCSEVDPDEPLRYGLTRRDGRGTEEPLREDEKYLVRVNPVDPSHAWLYHADGSFAGCADNYGRVDRENVSALHSAFARKRQALAPLIEDARRLSGEITRADIARTTHNARVANYEADRLKKYTGDVAELAEAETSNIELRTSNTEGGDDDFAAEGLL
jgi:hypothetical protein